MLDALQLGMIPLGIFPQPLTFRFVVDVPWGFTHMDLTLDIPDLPFEFEVLNRFCPSLWQGAYGSKLSSSAKTSLATVINWKGVGGLSMTVPFVTQSGFLNTTPAKERETGVAVLHTGHADNYARRRMYFPAMPRAWQTGELLNATGEQKIYDAVAVQYMSFKGSELYNPYKWLIAYPNVVPGETGNLFGVAFRQPLGVRVCTHCGKPPEGAGLDFP